MKYARLGVNIDHVATLRQQRGEYYPLVTQAAEIALQSGADQITIHLREDRRHIQDHDARAVHDVCKSNSQPLNFEMGCTEEMVSIAGQLRPAWVCLVPEKREERTTEGGLNILQEETFLKIKNACEALKRVSPQTKISLFVEANPEVLKSCFSLKADAVEIHTGEYAKDFLEKKDLIPHLKSYAEAHSLVKSKGWGFHAGHGLTINSLLPLLKQGKFEEYNIGHWIISEAIFMGLGPVILEMKNIIKQYPLKD